MTIVLYSTILYGVKGGVDIEKAQGGFLVSRIKQIQDRVFEKLLKAQGIEALNSAQGRILYVLWQQDGLPIVELSKRTGLAKTTLTSMLDRLERQGHVLRNLDTADRRSVFITLTGQARSLHGRYEAVSREMIGKFYRGFTDDEIGQFESYLQRVLENLKECE